MNKCWFWLGVLMMCACASVIPSTPNALTYLERFEDRKQLYQLHKEHKTLLLLINGQIYIAPEACYPFAPSKVAEDHSKRNQAEAASKRNLATGNKQRTVAQKNKGRKVAEESATRNTAQSSTARKVKEEHSQRVVAQASKKRKRAEATQKRNQAQATLNRNIATAQTERKVNEASTNRRVAMDSDHRKIANRTTQRQAAGAKEKYSCQCIDAKKRKGFELHGISKTKTIQVYDGMYLRTIDNNFVNTLNRKK